MQSLQDKSDGQKGAVGDGHTAQTTHRSGNAGSSHVLFSRVRLAKGVWAPSGTVRPASHTLLLGHKLLWL